MRIRFGTALLALSLAVSGLLAATGAPAGAVGIYRTDGNDAKGPLDLASVRLTEISGGDRFTIKTIAKFSAAQLDGDTGWVEIDIDTNADRDYEFWVAVFYYKGKLRAVQGHGKYADRYLPVRRVDARTVSFDLSHRYLGRIGSYDFASYSVWRSTPCSKSSPCVDVIPNRYPLMRHDWTPPRVRWQQVPAYATEASNSLTYAVSFSVRDNRYGSGIDHWTLQAMQPGGSWIDVRSGRSTNATVSVTGVEGEVTGVRVIAVDKQRNKVTSASKRTSVPLDDRNGALQYSAPPTLVDSPDAFLGTTSEMANTTTMTFTVPDNDALCVIGGPTAPGTTASATLFVGSQVWATMTETESTPPHSSVGCLNGFTTGGQALIVTVTTSTPFVLDGLGIVAL